MQRLDFDLDGGVVNTKSVNARGDEVAGRAQRRVRGVIIVGETDIRIRVGEGDSAEETVVAEVKDGALSIHGAVKEKKARPTKGDRPDTV
jgi:hypothetical protein